MSAPGTPRTIAHYELLSKIGAGGMGEVYRARDSKLGRDVAIKVLPHGSANESDYLARLQREAHLLASINHPNIAGIYGLEEGAIVMELVDGPTLADRMQHGPLPIDEALTVAKQIADAFEAAHEKGIIHRDLKPANVKITPEGIVKVLDFGLAKAVDAVDSHNSASSPTMTIRATQAGFILGTAAYMSPEQAAGKTVDRRSDIWSFGVVLWEMLTGKRMFDGETISHTLADVLRAPIDFDALPVSTPAPIRELVRRCLDRDVKTRLQSMGEARIAIQRYLANPGLSAQAPAPPAHRRSGIWIGISAAALILAAVAATGWYRTTRSVEGPLMRFTHDLGADLSLRDVTTGPSPYAGPAAVISPDGQRIVFVASMGNKQSQLYSRRLDENAATAIEGTEGASCPFFSQDGQWIGFFAGSKLWKVSVNGGLPTVIAEVGTTPPMGATWTSDGHVIASLGLSGALVRINATDGSRQTATTLDEKAENSHRWPQILPGGKAVLFSAGLGGGFEAGNISVQRLDTGERKVLHRGAVFGRYLPTGHLAFVAKGTLFAVPFDLAQLRVTGPPVQILQSLKYAPDSGGAQFDISRNGTLVYRHGSMDVGPQAIFRIEASGNRKQLLRLTGRWLESPILSPDGKRVAILKAEGAERQLWVFDLARDVSTRLTFESSMPIRARWSPDGNRVIYGQRGGMYWQRADGAGTATRLSQQFGRPVGMTPDKRQLLFIGGDGADLRCWAAPVHGEEDQARLGKEALCFEGSLPVPHCELSPDGKWVAYVSPESGRFEVYVRSFPDTGAKWQVSMGGGTVPEWSRKSNELFFLSLDEQLMVASYRIEGGSFVGSRPRQWLNVPTALVYASDRQFSLTPDGTGIVVVGQEAERKVSNAQVNVVLNFFDEVKRKMAGRAGL